MNEPDFDDAAGPMTPIASNDPTPGAGRGIDPSFFDHIRVWWQNFKCRGMKKAVDKITLEIQKDPDLWRSYHANYACVIADSLKTEFAGLTQREAMVIGNNCADRVMAHFYKAPRKPEHYP